MFNRIFFPMGILALILTFSTGSALAHIPLCACYDDGDGTITCEGGFSDGSTASGVWMRIEDKSGNILIEGKMDEDGEFSFAKPAEAFSVVFDSGDGHTIQIDGNDIVK